MKFNDTANFRFFIALCIALLLGVVTVSFGYGKTARNFIGKMEAAMTNATFKESQSPAPLNAPASPVQQKKKEQLFTGKRMKAEEAVNQAKLIVVGKIVDVGIRSPDFAGKTHHGQVKVEVFQTLRGDMPVEPLSLSFSVEDTHPTLTDQGEEAPELDQLYIFFIKGKAMNAIKILPYTEENLNKTFSLVNSDTNEHQ